MAIWVYIVKCSDGSYYTGSHRGSNVMDRVDEHNSGKHGGYTNKRRPVELVWANEFQSIREGISWERQIKGWSRAKKEALIHGDIVELKRLSNVNNPSSSSG